MKSRYYSYNFDNSILMAIPSVHHQTAFANNVHRICRNPKLRPNAIAVELGHPLVIELVSFLKDLKQGGSEKVNMPCMLGIMKRNRFIHTDHIEKALMLQKFYSSPLAELPDDLLSDRLRFSKWSTLYMSPADSIIEAVRCAVELDIPVYGIDLNDFAHTKKDKMSFEDPQSAHINMVEYGNRTMKYCDAERDPHIDNNRETFMVRGLKYCLSKHTKVLFVCGMAHWKNIVSMLKDDVVTAFPVHEIECDSELRRVIVYPSLAVTCMEIIPQITFDYERNRFPITAVKKTLKTIKPEIKVRNCLDKVYKEYITKSEILINSNAAYWSDINSFEQYLFNFASVRQVKIPRFAELLESAQTMMNSNFCRILVQKIMDVNPIWASQKEFPGLPLIEPGLRERTDAKRRISSRNIRIISHQLVEGHHESSVESDTYTDLTINQEFESIGIDEIWEWDQTIKEMQHRSRVGNPWIWPPCESLIYGLAFKAAELSVLNQKQFNQSSVFEGSLEGGVDVKATIKSILRGEHKVYVSKLASSLDQSILDGVNPDPFVLLYPKDEDTLGSELAFYTAGSELVEFVKDPDQYRKICSEKGWVFVSSVVFEKKVAPPSHLSPLVNDISKTYGTVMFGNPCINARQSASWLESADYKCCPILFHYHMTSLLDYYSTNFDLVFNLSDWEESLIRMAIPYAKKMVTIVARDSFKIPECVREEASRKRIILNIVSFSNFSEAQLKESQLRYSIRTLDRTGINFPPETEVLLGQSKEKYFEMLPYAIRRQVGYSDSI